MSVFVKLCDKCKGNFLHEYSEWRRQYVCTKCMRSLLDAEANQGY
jgi:hypothetical protein